MLELGAEQQLPGAGIAGVEEGEVVTLALRVVPTQR